MRNTCPIPFRSGYPALLALAMLLLASCTPNWLKISDQADVLFERGDLESAAEAYLEAYAEKPSRKELTYKAAEAYSKMRNYEAAASAYAPVAEEIKDFPLAGLKYGRSLKQSGNYNQAIAALQAYLDAYPTENKSSMEEVIYREIEGARLGLRATMPNDPNLTFSRLGGVINSDGEEYAPISFPNEILYFTSTVGGEAQLYRTQRDGESWARPAVPETFPRIQGQAYGHGSLAPDGSSFYFTICGESTTFSPATNPCAIYVLRRISGVWSQPERLSEVVNQTGAATTQPFVTHRDGKEWLFFASNRTGGAGGMDIWYTSRDLQGNMGFQSPANLGPAINTSGNEMTPFFDVDAGELYFASDGLVSMGGLDIYKARGFSSNWTEPENLGLPYNSPADDYYLALKSDGSGAFWASNRLVRGEKNTTLDDDLFELTSRLAPVSVSASVFNGRTNQLLDNFNVRVMELDASNNESMLMDQPFTGGTYSIDLVPGKKYRVEVMSPGFESFSYELEMESGPNASYGRPVYLNPAAAPGPTQPEPSSPMTDESGRQLMGPLGEEYSARGTGPRDSAPYTSTAARYEGTYYRIQLVAVRRFDPSKFSGVRNYGQSLDTEVLSSNNLNRVLIGPYFSRSEAESARRRIRNAGFSSAYIVEYRNGTRYQ